MHLGKNQLSTLKMLGCPSAAQVVGCNVSRSLERRGLLRSDNDSFFCITPAGLRVLADALEAGRIDGAIEWSRREREKNLARKARGELEI